MLPKMLMQVQRRRIRWSRGTVLRDYGPDEAASNRRRAVGTAGPFQGLRADREQRTPPSTPQGPQYLSRNYRPDGSAGWLCRSTPRQTDDTTTRPFGSGPTRQSDARDSESSSTWQGPTRPGLGTFPLLMRRCFEMTTNSVLRLLFYSSITSCSDMCAAEDTR